MASSPLINTCDESADETEVDEGHEDGRITGGFPTKQSGYGPNSGKDRHYEEDSGAALAWRISQQTEETTHKI
ncbi:MAG: hypothetical protein LQ342_006616 [Letrouitia transgressa]|nr:MAG: hypothetical protein LQ342_006616 [Letrouitia transgressa]